MGKINMVKNLIITKMMVKKKYNKVNLKKKAGFDHWVTVGVACALALILAGIFKDPLKDLGTWLATELTRIVKAWFTGL